MRIAAGIPGAKRVQRLGVVAAIALGALAFTGCSAINEQSTTRIYSASDGVMLDIGALKLRNVLVISAADGGAGRFTGTFYNTSDADIKVTVSGAQGSQTEFTVPAGDKPFVLDTKNDAAILSTVSSIPGAIETLKFRTSVVTDAKELNVPVLDGTLAEYKNLVPTAAPEAEASPSAESSATAESSESATAEASATATESGH